PPMCQIRRRNWERIITFFNYPPEIRKAIYTTNSVEALHRSLRKIIKTRGAFPHEDAALKLLFLALRQAAKKWTMPVHHWRDALNHVTVLWPERMLSTENGGMNDKTLLYGRCRGRVPLPLQPHPNRKTNNKTRSFTQKIGHTRA